MAEILKAISHPYRLEIIEILKANEVVFVAEILEQIDIECPIIQLK